MEAWRFSEKGMISALQAGTVFPYIAEPGHGHPASRALAQLCIDPRTMLPKLLFRFEMHSHPQL
jgi:hypothetical protein